MKKWKEYFIHLLFWLCTGWLIASSYSIQSHDIEIQNGIESVIIIRNNGLIYQLLICIIFCLIAFYINAWFIIKRNKTTKTNSAIWHSVLTFVILSILVYAVTEIRLLENTPPIPKQTAFGIAIFYFSVSVAYALVKNSIFINHRHQQLLIDKKQTELNLLRNQLQPHFLFNALNNLMAMVNPSESPKIMDSFDKLSQLLRFVIEDNKTKKISVAKEIEFLNNYIDLQMLRFEKGEVNVQFNVKGENAQHYVEPGLFIPFVENAFKYGTEPEKHSKIDIQFDLSRAHSIQFEIKNKILMNNTKGIGTGIETTKKRLRLIYPDAHELHISNTDDFTVKLTIYTK